MRRKNRVTGYIARHVQGWKWYDYPIKGGKDMPQIIPIKDLKNTSEISEKQISEGKVTDARKSLASLREHYGL